ncbi:MAG: bis(5'-nucleosyl)-tetraphosphatase (symmetrical) YqeK [Streptococcaceae bacterium]|jgi:predicted HD superfamily hydrolase involved in NAD metabolism|nr:bis(5'-nucleosyl)-tetraphosphatase (symmetrical) YqeK [Streptococcaceae bacterium]
MGNDIYVKYTAFKQDELLKKIRMSISEKRFKHSLAVQKTAVLLAKRFDCNLEKASIAGLVHDYAKERSDEEMIRIIYENNLDETIIAFGNNIWHGVAGAILIKKELGIIDAKILQAVTVHTTGSSNMSLLDKIIYVADFIEPNRNFPGVSKARKLAKVNLDKVVKYEIKRTLLRLLENEAKIYPKTMDTYNKYVAGVNQLST